MLFQIKPGCLKQMPIQALWVNITSHILSSPLASACHHRMQVLYPHQCYQWCDALYLFIVPWKIHAFKLRELLRVFGGMQMGMWRWGNQNDCTTAHMRCVWTCGDFFVEKHIGKKSEVTQMLDLYSAYKKKSAHFARFGSVFSGSTGSLGCSHPTSNRSWRFWVEP